MAGYPVDVPNASSTCRLSVLSRSKRWQSFCTPPFARRLGVIILALGLFLGCVGELEREFPTEWIAKARQGDVLRLRELIASGVDVNFQMPKRGYTALMMAAAGNHVECVDILLANDGIRVDIKDEVGMTALMHAALGGRAEPARLLLAAGANPSARDNGARTAFLYACRGSDDRVDMVKLLAQQSDTCVMDAYERNAIHYLALSEDCAERLRYLLSTEALGLIDQKDEGGDTPLILAAGHSNRSGIEILLKHGARTDLRNSEGSDAVFEAALENDARSVELLTGAGATLFTGEHERDLLIASAMGDLARVTDLLETGTQQVEPYERRALDLAVVHGHIDVVGKLLAYGVPVDATCLNHAKIRGDSDMIQLLANSRRDAE